MASPVTVTTPDFTGYVDQRFFIEPLSGLENPLHYLDRFPEEVYNKSVDSHLVRFMYTLLGPAGTGWLRKNYLQARLLLEDYGIETFSLDKFYGNPLQFGRILEEIYEEDPLGLLPREEWERIRAKDARYRNRAIDFVNGARAGGTKEGIRLVARSGLGHEADVVEHYRWLYDQLSDDPLGLPRYGKTDLTEEVVIVPRHELGNEVDYIGPRDMRYLQAAIDRVRPQTMIPTYGYGGTTRSRQNWIATAASSEFIEVVRYATGSAGVPWPARDATHWVEAEVEHEARKSYGDGRHHYQGFHNVREVVSYVETALDDPDYLTDSWPERMVLYRDNHVGEFSAAQRSLFPVLTNGASEELTADRILADYTELLTVQSVIERDGEAHAFVNGIYPLDYQELPGIPRIRYSDEQFWSSKERAEGDDYIEIDLGSAQAVNFLAFEATRKPFDIEVSYDLLGMAPLREFVPVTVNQATSAISASYAPGSTNPWTPIEIYFANARGEMIFTRFIRIKFARRIDEGSPFVDTNGELQPYSIDIRNLRLGRNVA